MKIAEIFDEISKKMVIDFEEALKALKHPGLKGSSHEESFRSFPKKYLPKSLDISTGVVVDSLGNISKQLDVIISDSQKTPIFYSSGDIRVIPIECIYAVIEVKTHIDKAELQKIFLNMESVKSLKKQAFYKENGAIILHNCEMYGKTWEIWPVNYFVFAYDSIDLNTIAEYIHEYNQDKNYPIENSIDTLCVLSKGIICNQNKDGLLDALPSPGSKLHVSKTTRTLLLFFTLTARYFNQVTMPNFNFLPYLGKMSF